MDKLWSPWRSKKFRTYAYQPPAGEGSIFTRIANDDHDEETMIIHRGELVFVVMNIYPYTNGHILVVPYREVADIRDLAEAELTEMALITQKCISWLDEALHPHGYNIGLNMGSESGASISEHLHQHIVPRWRGDTNFMPVLTGTKTISMALQETYERILATKEKLKK